MITVKILCLLVAEDAAVECINLKSFGMSSVLRTHICAAHWFLDKTSRV